MFTNLKIDIRLILLTALISFFFICLAPFFDPFFLKQLYLFTLIPILIISLLPEPRKLTPKEMDQMAYNSLLNQATKGFVQQEMYQMEYDSLLKNITE